jgi:hypothetical protein
VPVTQVPLEQQPWLHGCESLQLVVQRWVPVSQASPTGQSPVTLQPHWWARHWWPSLETVQSTHRSLAAPQAPGAVPRAQVPLEQQAPLQGWLAEQPVVQAWAPVSQEAPEEQSPMLLQPQVPPPVAVTQAEPTPLPRQPWQAPPLLPQAPWMVPPAQVPLLQQPPLHGSTEVQAVPQVWLARLQAWLAGQSAGPLQPQPPLTQAVPALAPLQSRQARPLAPQVPCAVPSLQAPDWQQPPLHGCVPLQALVQVWMARSQAWAGGQSSGPLQPQAPPPATVMQTPPAGLVEQGVQVLPEAPQPVGEVPAAQTPESQQPLWHGWVGLQAVVHWWSGT